MNILLVDNANRELTSVKSALQDDHQLTLVDDAFNALAVLAKKKYDLVITVFTLDKMDGEELLKSITTEYPSIVRVLIIDTLSSDVAKKVSNVAHQLFCQPIDTSKVCITIKKLSPCKQAVTKEAIIKAVAKVKTLPSPPKVYMQLNAMLQDSNTDSQKIAEVITQDPALTAKVLQFSNNSFLKGKSVNSINDAITRMGVDTLCCIVMTAEMFSYQVDIEGFDIEKEQLHALATAKLAASLVKPEFKQQAMIAGLLHDIGKLVLYQIDGKLTKTFFKHKSTNSDNLPLEKKVFSSNHCHIGGYLLHLWSFSYKTIEAIILHHNPEKLLKKDFAIAQAVYVANKLTTEQEIDPTFIQHYKLDKVLEKLQLRAAKFIK